MVVKIVKVLKCKSEPYFAQFTPDGKTLVTGATDSMTLWNVSTWKPERVFKMNDIPRSIAFSKHHNVMGLGTAWYHNLHIWDAQTWKQRNTFSGHPQEVTTVCLDDEGRFVASGGATNEVLYVRDVRKNRNVFTYRSDECTNSLALSPDGKLLAAVIGQRVLIWETQNWKIVHKISQGTAYFHSVVFSPDSKMLACACDYNNATVLLVQCSSWKTVGTLTGHIGIVDALRFSHDSKILASAPSSRIKSVVKLWNTQTGTLLFDVDEPGRSHVDLSFHPFQNVLASACNDGIVTMYQISD